MGYRPMIALGAFRGEKAFDRYLRTVYNALSIPVIPSDYWA